MDPSRRGLLRGASPARGPSPGGPERVLAALTVFTIGHSTRALAEFVELLRSFGVQQVLDVRTIPRSRHNPQFNGDVLPVTLREHGLEYRHLKDLGGLRHARADSPNLGWHNLSFRGFADYMQTEAFRAALAELIGLVSACPAALMCAEAVPWRCHRYLIADALLLKQMVSQTMVCESTRVKDEGTTAVAAQPAHNARPDARR